MPSLDTIPPGLKPFLAHGIELKWGSTGDQAVGDCPFCERSKLHAALSNGLWDCKTCGVTGNPVTFLRRYWELCYQVETDYDQLVSTRGLLYPDTLQQWGLCKSLHKDQWLVPAYNSEGNLVQLYRYLLSTTGKYLLLPTPECGHGIHGLVEEFFDHSKPEVYIAEGVWDGMVLWEVLQRCKRDKNKLVQTSLDYSIFTTANVIAIPSANVFYDSWCSLFSDKKVYLLYDSDHPKVSSSGLVTPPVGYNGMRKVAEALLASEKPPAEIHYLHWGSEGYDPDHPSGYDLRNVLTEAANG